MVTELKVNMPGRVYAQKLLEDIEKCCNSNVNLISCSDYYALRLLVRELSVDRIPNNDDPYLMYFVYSRSLEGTEKQLREGQKMLLEDLIEYRNKRRNDALPTLNSFIRALGGY